MVARSLDVTASRRVMLGGMATAFTAACAGTTGIGRAQSSATLSSRPIDINAREDNVRAYLKIISDLSEKPTYRYHTGRILAVPKHLHLGEPFVDFVAIKQDRVRELPGGVFQHAYRGIILFTDKDSGEILETFQNPLTGETNEVKHYKTSRGAINYIPEGVYFRRIGGNPSPLSPENEKPMRLAWSSAGDDTWVTYDERFSFSDKDGNHVAADNSMYRYMTNMRQLQDMGLTSADMAMSWQTETMFWSWMNMSGHPGHLIFGSMGGKYGSIDELPQKHVQWAQAYLPDHLTDTIDWADHPLEAKYPG